VTYEFIAPFIQTYVRTTQRQKWVDARYKRYQKAKAVFRAIADTAHIPADLSRAASVEISVFWKARPRGDLDNVVKFVLDALWKQDRKVTEISAKAIPNSRADLLSVRVHVLG
jgi:Holliday junction resolvase RusA-like endonuclease